MTSHDVVKSAILDLPYWISRFPQEARKQQIDKTKIIDDNGAFLRSSTDKEKQFTNPGVNEQLMKVSASRSTIQFLSNNNNKGCDIRSAIYVSLREKIPGACVIEIDVNIF